MKGISPMISVVLLLAFTVAVGGILSVWLSGFTRTATTGVETTTTNQTKCAGTYIDVVSVTSNAVMITNRGSQDIASVTCYTGNGTQLGGISGTLSPGGFDSSYWNASATAIATSYVAGFGTVVVCSGQCLNIGVTGDCESGESCWKI